MQEIAKKALARKARMEVEAKKQTTAGEMPKDEQKRVPQERDEGELTHVLRRGFAVIGRGLQPKETPEEKKEDDDVWK